jgi:hypothetical protein
MEKVFIMTITLKKIDDKIATFSTNRAKLQVLGHEIAMLIFMHAAPKQVSDDCSGTGDCTRALKLAKQMPKSWQTQLENWFKAYSPIRLVTKNDKCEYDPKYKAEKDVDAKLAYWKLAEANETPFYELDEPESATQVLTLEQILAMLPALAKRIDQKIEKNEVVDADKPQAALVSAAIKALNFARAKSIVTEGADNDANADETAAAKTA